MVRKWKLSATGTALLASAFVIVACSSKSDDDDNGGSSGKGGTGASGGTGGTAAGASGKGGTATGGTGGSTGGTTGGSAGTGTTTGGSGGMSGGAGMGAAGMAGFACVAPPAASCNTLETWGSFSGPSGSFGGGLYVYGGLAYDMTNTGAFHITGTVTTYSGFGIYFNKCSDISAYTSVTFTMTGTTTSTDKPNVTVFVAQRNSDEPADTTNMKGSCPGMAGNPCTSPHKGPVMPSAAPQTIAFADLAGGVPDAALDPKQVLGFQWQLNPDTVAMPGYTVDITIDNLMMGTATTSSIGAAGGSGVAGSGSAGTGSGSGGASSGGASSGGAPSAGGAPGAGGASGSTILCTPAATTGGMGGMSGAGGSGGATGGNGGSAAGSGGATGGNGAGGAMGGRGGNGAGGRTGGRGGMAGGG